MKQTLLIEVEVEADRGDDSLNTAKEIVCDQWDNLPWVNGARVRLIAARFCVEHAR